MSWYEEDGVFGTPQKCAESLLIPCVFFFSSTPTFILIHHLVWYGGKKRADEDGEKSVDEK